MIRFRRRAKQDLREQLEYLRERSPGAARRLLTEIGQLLRALDARDFEGTTVQLRSGRTVKTWAAPPLRIYDERRGSMLYVLRLYHQARRPITR